MTAQLFHDLNSNRKIRFAQFMTVNIDRYACETNFYWTLVKNYLKFANTFRVETLSITVRIGTTNRPCRVEKHARHIRKNLALNNDGYHFPNKLDKRHPIFINPNFPGKFTKLRKE